MPFGASFLAWNNLICSQQFSSSTYGGFLSCRTDLTRGVRQGRPLSFNLFNLIIESLAVLIRNNSGIFGLLIVSKDMEILLYTDDVVLFKTNPKQSLPRLLY